jgi:broad specificity phosphatase PhoE
MRSARILRAPLAGLFLLLTTLGAASPAAPAPAPERSGLPALVLLVRHGEKAAEPAGDPPLSAAGTVRAKALAAALADAQVSAVITTQWIRTRETAAPLVQAIGKTPEVVETHKGETPAAHIEAVAAAVRRHPGEVVLVVGHSNTIPAIVTALGGPKLPDLCDASFSDLFVLVPGPDGAHLVRSHYGPPDAAACP